MSKKVSPELVNRIKGLVKDLLDPQSKGNIIEELKGMVQGAELDDILGIELDDKVCHCGTYKDAVDAAFKDHEAFLRGSDCVLWRFTTLTLAQQILLNDLCHAKMEDDGLSHEDAAKLTQQLAEALQGRTLAMMHKNKETFVERAKALRSQKKDMN